MFGQSINHVLSIKSSYWKVEYVNTLSQHHEKYVSLHCFRYITSFPACFIHTRWPGCTMLTQRG